MEKLFVPYHIALLAKEKGFDRPCVGYYSTINKELKFPTDINIISSQEKCEYVTFGFQAPLYDQLADWFLEEHKIFISCTFSWSNGYDGLVEDNKTNNWRLTGYNKDKYVSLTKAFEEAFKLI